MRLAESAATPRISILRHFKHSHGRFSLLRRIKSVEPHNVSRGIVRDSTYPSIPGFCDYRHLLGREASGYVLWRCPCLRRLRQAKGIPQNHSSRIKWLKMLSQIAASNRRYCASSATYYLKKREAGLSHWQAVKCLARQLIRVIFALFRDDTFYHHQNSKAA